jgi:hypothetical protein
VTTAHEERTYTFDHHKELPDGPWVDEPDKIQWVDEATGLDCLIVRNRTGALCGYVGVPESHPAYGVDFDDMYEKYPDINVHGGLTFSNVCAEDEGDEAVCHVPYPGRSANVWWLGFDCAHAWDLVPGMLVLHAALPDLPQRRGDVYRDVDYVRAQVTELAAQLASATVNIYEEP